MLKKLFFRKQFMAIILSVIIILILASPILAAPIWVSLGTIAPTEVNIESLVSLGNGVALGGTYPHGGIITTTDYGNTWSYHANIIGGGCSRIRLLLNLGGGIVIAGTRPNGQIGRSINSGATWVDLGAGAAGATPGEVGIFAMASANSTVAYVGTGEHGYVVKTTDAGATWVSKGQPIAGETFIGGVAVTDNGTVVVGGTISGNITQSFDGGTTWNASSHLVGGGIRCIISTGGENLVAGTTSGNLLYSTDSGQNWTDAGIPVLGNTIWVLTYDPIDNVVLGGTGADAHIVISYDKGINWTDQGNIISGETYVQSLAYLGNSVALAGTADLGKIAKTALTVTTGVSSQSGFVATLTGSVTNMGVAASNNVSFDWGNDLGYGHSSASSVVYAVGSFSTNINGYDPTKMVYYRAVGTNGLLNSYGAGSSFIPSNAFVSSYQVNILIPIALIAVFLFMLLSLLAKSEMNSVVLIVIMVVMAYLLVAGLGGIQVGLNSLWGG